MTWWGIYNEPNINNNLDADLYTTMYNALVPAMQAVDPSIKFAALELCCGSENWAATFAAGVTARVDVMATHFYSSCNQKDSDALVLATVPGFASSVQTIYTNVLTNPVLADVPVWVTENNVNADYSDNGISNCNPRTSFRSGPAGIESRSSPRGGRMFFRSSENPEPRRCITGTSARISNTERLITVRTRCNSATGWTTGWDKNFRRKLGRNCCSSRRRMIWISKRCLCTTATAAWW